MKNITAAFDWWWSVIEWMAGYYLDIAVPGFILGSLIVAIYQGVSYHKKYKNWLSGATNYKPTFMPDEEIWQGFAGALMLSVMWIVIVGFIPLLLLISAYFIAVYLSRVAGGKFAVTKVGVEVMAVSDNPEIRREAEQILSKKSP